MLAFIHIEKTAGGTISWMLRSTFGIHHCDVSPRGYRWGEFKTFMPDDLAWTCKLHPGLESIAGHTVTPYARLEETGIDIHYFTLLRDPIKQCASYYQFVCTKTGKRPDFEEWITREWPRNMQTKRLAGVADASRAIEIIKNKDIFVGLQENFDESMVMLKELVEPRLNPNYISQNIAPSQKLAKNLFDSERFRELLQEATSADSELYDWVKRELFPIYRQSYYEKTGVEATNSYIGKVPVINRLKVFYNRVYRNLVYRPLWKLHDKLT